MKKSKKILDYGIYEVSNDYINYLSRHDNKVEKSEGSNYIKERKYLAIILNNGEQYLIPFSSPKLTDYKNDKPRNSVTPIIRITERDLQGNIQLLGKLKNSSMIPIKEENIKEIKKYDVTKEKDINYKSLIYKQINFILKNKYLIEKNANQIYKEKLENLKDNKYSEKAYIKHTVNFKKLEKAALKYSKVKNLSNSIDSAKGISIPDKKKVTININRSKNNKIIVKQASRSNTVKVKAKKISTDKGNDHEL